LLTSQLEKKDDPLLKLVQLCALLASKLGKKDDLLLKLRENREDSQCIMDYRHDNRTNVKIHQIPTSANDNELMIVRQTSFIFIEVALEVIRLLETT